MNFPPGRSIKSIQPVYTPNNVHSPSGKGRDGAGVSKADTCCIDSVQYKSILMPNVLKCSFLCFGMGLYKIGEQGGE